MGGMRRGGCGIEVETGGIVWGVRFVGIQDCAGWVGIPIYAAYLRVGRGAEEWRQRG